MVAITGVCRRCANTNNGRFTDHSMRAFCALGSTADSRSTINASRRWDGTKRWSMLQKQEHIYKTMFSSGEVIVDSYGCPKTTNALIEALRLQWAYGHPYTPKGFPLLTHAFHTYPAGMQPATARHLLDTVLPGQSVLDPFVGGGTVVVEAIRAGRVAIGCDISPLALFVSRGRCWKASNEALERLRQAARAVVAISAADLGHPRSRRICAEDWEVIKAAIAEHLAEETIEDTDLEHALWFIFTVARSRAAKARHRRRSLVAAEYFSVVVDEYATAVAGLAREAAASAAPLHPPSPILLRRDARQPIELPLRPSTTADATRRRSGSERQGVRGDRGVVTADDSEYAIAQGHAQEVAEPLHFSKGVEDSPLRRSFWGSAVDAILTSPPYPGVYDYLSEARYARSRMGTLPQRQQVQKESGCIGGLDAASAFTDDAASAVATRAGVSDVRQAGTSSIFLDSPVPAGRDWPSHWTEGEIGAKSQVRQRRRQAHVADVELEADGSCRVHDVTEGTTAPRKDCAQEWEEDQNDWLEATASALRARGGRMAVMVGDGDRVDTRTSLVRAIEGMSSRANEGGVRVIAWATLRAAEGAKRSMRTEHIVLAEKS